MNVFVLLDSNRHVSQSIQHLVIREFANQEGLDIDFYGAEMYGYEYRHMLLRDYINANRYKAYLFFTIKQFQKNNNINYDFDLLNIFLKKNLKIFFANEKIILKKCNDFEDIYKKLLISEICNFNKQDINI